MSLSLSLLAREFDAAIVDLDGTMVDTQGDFVAALGLVLDELGLPRVDRAFVARTVGKGSEHLLRRTLEQVDGDPSLYEAAWDAYQRPYLAINGSASEVYAGVDLGGAAWDAYQRHYLAINGSASEVYAGVAEGLELLRGAGLRLACLTNKPLAFARPLLASKGLDGYFELVFGGDSFARKKPDPLPLLETCRALGTQPARTLMLGDSRNDAEAAHAAGCPVALVTYGYNHGEPVVQVPALAYLDRIDQLRR